MLCFCSGPAERSRRPTGRNNKNTLHTRGRQQKKNLETNDTGHEQKGATTKKKLTDPPGPWWCFFCCGPARTLTHSVWAGAISARPGWCVFFFFWLRPRPTRRANNKNCLVGLKRPGGATAKKKKNTTSSLNHHGVKYVAEVWINPSCSLAAFKEPFKEPFKKPFEQPFGEPFEEPSNEPFKKKT